MTSIPSDTRPRDKRGVIGVITSSHGVRGQVKIRSFTEPPEDILTRTPITNATGSRPFKLTKHGIKEQLIIVSIAGIDDRNAADLLKGTELFGPARESTQEDDKWTYAQLTGMEVRLANGKAYGTIIGVYNFGAGDILDIKLTNGKTEMLPFEQDFIGDVNPEEGYVVVIPPEYLEPSEEP